MARIEISSVSNPYGTGELQLQGKVAMSGTLTAVTDNLNNASPLKLSTGGVQVASTLQITTNSNPYIDAEDGSGNNRFQVGRDPSSQVVNVDFASNPTGGTSQVGAIRTYTDGVSLSNVMSFRKDGYIGVGTGTLSPQSQLQVMNDVIVGRRGFDGNEQNGTLRVVSASTFGSLGFSSKYDLFASGLRSYAIDTLYERDLRFYTKNQDANANDGTEKMRILGNGRVGINETAPISQLQIKGSGSTSATTSLLVQNSGGNTAFQVTDDLTASVGDGYSGDGIRFEAGNNSSIVFRQGADRITLTRTNGDNLKISPLSKTFTEIGEGICNDGSGVNFWKFEGAIVTPVALDNTKYLKVFVGGVAYKIAVCV